LYLSDRLQVYFTWVIRDFGTAEWFHSLLHAIETQDTQNRIEINIYLTQRIKEDDMNNIIVSTFSHMRRCHRAHVAPVGPRRRRGKGRDHLSPRPDTLRASELG
jgi:hypothetical protein